MTVLLAAPCGLVVGYLVAWIGGYLVEALGDVFDDLLD